MWISAAARLATAATMALTPTAAAAAATAAPMPPPLPFLIHACTLSAPMAAVVVFLAPIPTMRQIQRDKSVSSLPLLPYSSMFANSYLWTAYGLLKKEPAIWSGNAVGCLLSIYYLRTFVKFAPKSAPTLPGPKWLHVQGAAGVALIVTAMAVGMQTSKCAPLIGMAGVIICVLMFASPLAALKTVIQTKSAASIPLPFTIASTINCFLWSVAGIWDLRDVNIWLPNVLALGFGLIQIALKIIYSAAWTKKNDDGTTTTEPLIESTQAEMGQLSGEEAGRGGEL